MVQDEDGKAYLFMDADHVDHWHGNVRGLSDSGKGGFQTVRGSARAFLPGGSDAV
ncbi:MAG: hypothetical protein NC548_64910 [Lachnospiraceae bacterium]|nr:hypothetical protein [Lachnospiraceae bacterium]